MPEPTAGLIQRAKDLFALAAELDPDAREAVLADRCADEPELRALVERLLAAAGSDSTVACAPPEIEAKSIGPYRILGMLGRGGMGEVYLAEQRTPVRRSVALKVVGVGLGSKQVVARFDAERQALAMMEHPNIAKVFDAGTADDGRAYFTMEYVKGVPITDYCDKHRLTVRDRIELFAQVCHGVHHAHQKGVIHRDLKPANLLVKTVDSRPLAKIIDFGIAKATAFRLTEQTVFTEHGQLIGTPAYMSPEQVDSSGVEVVAASDIYTLGAILYELLVGVLPLELDELRPSGLYAIQRQIVETEPATLTDRLTTLGARAEEIAKLRGTGTRRLRSTMRGSLERIVMQAIAKDPTARYESAHHLAEDLERWLADQPVHARRMGLVRRFRRSVRRHPWVALACSAAAIAAIAWTLSPSRADLRAMYDFPYWYGPAERNAAFGQSVAPAGDVDGDGHPDVVIGAPLYYEPKSPTDAGDHVGQAAVFSGKDGRQLHVLVGARRSYDRLGQSVTGGGDLGDGNGDLQVIGAWGHEKKGAVFAYKGKRSYDPLWKRSGDAAGDHFGKAVAIAGDVDGDGVEDVLVGASQNRRPKKRGYVRVLSGVDGKTLGTVQGKVDGALFGTSVAGAGDLDGDGRAEILVGACAEDVTHDGEVLQDGGAIYVFTLGEDGLRLVRRLAGVHANGQFGWKVAAAGDLNGDGQLDIMASDCWSELGFVRVFSGKDFSILTTLEGERPGHQFGRAIASIGDLDRDGCEEIAVGTNPLQPQPGYVLVFSGRDQRVLCRIEARSHGDQFGLSIAGVGDLDRDGLPDVVVGAPALGFAGGAYPISGAEILRRERLRVPGR